MSSHPGVLWLLLMFGRAGGVAYLRGWTQPPRPSVKAGDRIVARWTTPTGGWLGNPGECIMEGESYRVLRVDDDLGSRRDRGGDVPWVLIDLGHGRPERMMPLSDFEQEPLDAADLIAHLETEMADRFAAFDARLSALEAGRLPSPQVDR